jgi:hypothetical protein
MLTVGIYRGIRVCRRIRPRLSAAHVHADDVRNNINKA